MLAKHKSPAFHPSIIFTNRIISGFRESAYVYALTAAGVAHAVAKACAQGRLLSCSCDPLGYRTSHEPKNLKNNRWEWTGCSHNLQYGVEFSKRFLDIREHDDDLQSKINLHNNDAGRSVSFVCFVLCRPSSSSLKEHLKTPDNISYYSIDRMRRK